MKLFHGKPGPRPAAQVALEGKRGPRLRTSHRLTLELSRAEKLAGMVAASRGAAMVEIADLVAGMYLYDWERLSKYWDDEQQPAIEKTLQHVCEISPQRWHHWVERFDKKRHAEEKPRGWRALFAKDPEKIPAAEPLPHSIALTKLFKASEKVTPHRDKASGREIPILTSESVLLCMVRRRDSELAMQLAFSGLNLPMLEKATLTTRRKTQGE